MRLWRRFLVTGMLLLGTGLLATPMLPTEHQKVMDQIWYVAAVAEDEFFFHVYSAIVWNESRFVHNTINYNTDGSYDYGIAQLNSRYFPPNKLCREQDPRTAIGNVRIGARFFLSLVRMFKGDYYDAVMAYNCGPTAVKVGRIPMSTRMYAERVIHRAEVSRAFSRD